MSDEEPREPQEEPVDAQVVAEPDEAEDFTPSGAELVPTDPTDRLDVAQVLDRNDIRDVVQALQGRLSPRLLYDFPQDGTRVVDLSVQGVNECIRELNNHGLSIAIDTSVGIEWGYTVEDTDYGPQKYVWATVYARDGRMGTGEYGTAGVPQRFKLKPETVQRRKQRKKYVPDPDENGNVVMSDPFARTKALNMAQRNALKTQIPEVVRETLVAQYKGDDIATVRIQAGAGAESLADLPPPLTTPEADALRGEIRELYARLHDVDPMKLLPAAFHAYMTRSEFSLEKLEEFKAYVAQRLEEAQQGAASK